MNTLTIGVFKKRHNKKSQGVFFGYVLLRIKRLIDMKKARRGAALFFIIAPPFSKK